ncbi:MAG TPA: hypothetical protein VJT50_11040 [Pyrinomonadaceae bacterium]|nr:hypothetical protein [Pyrinomonadaceae bacterium]
MGLVASVALLFRDRDAVAISAARPWPGEMGTLYSVNDRWPPQKANAASVKLTELGSALPKNDAIEEFVAREITRGELTIGNPPALPDVALIRELLLREPVIWERYDEIGAQQATAARVMQMTMARALVANALAKARANDAAAWDDLFATWKLARTLDAHPQMMAQTAALAMARMINAAAWKMPLPAPEWFQDLQLHDNVQRLLEAFQFQTASYWRNNAWIFPTKWLAGSVEHDRKIAEELSRMSQCDVNASINELGVDLSSLWRRAFRYRAEREATANALRARAGKAIETGSRCSDGAWTFDGKTVRFNREITTAAPDKPMPLVLTVKP